MDRNDTPRCRKASTWVAAFAAAALSGAAGAADSGDRNPLDYPLKQYALLLATALLGGLVSWYAKVKAGDLRGYALTHLIGELCTSAFAGLLCFWLCEAARTPQLVTISLVGIAGHMGTRAITTFESYAARRWGLSRPAEEKTGRQ